MKSPVFANLRGVVTIVVRGKSIELLVNELTKKEIQVWDLKPLPDGTMEMNIQLADFFKLRPLLKRTGCRLSVKRRSGIPFMMVRLWKRKWFVFGFALFIGVVLALSSLVWDIEVEGNSKIPKEDILLAARSEGVYPFQWIYRLPRQDELSKDLARKLSGVSWVGVSRTGTKITIQIVEASKPKELELMNPRSFVSTSDAVVTRIYAERGNPEVRKNDRVRKGQILISGEQGGKRVVAKGEVRGIVWHEYNIEIPLLRKQKVYTGEKKERGYLYFGKTAIQLTGYGKVDFEKSNTMTKMDPLTWRSFKLPIGWMSEEIMETTFIELAISEEKAKNDGIEAAKRDIMSKYGTNSVVLSQKILHEKTENGKVYMKVHFEVDQDIAKELPIVQ
ncbi:sporulation protein YqfD [Paenibacillus motobuensis]|uniref:Sporulation protein YqfD n=1 Tax=Paenibacillus motobuensis TaxID=295324 RepID=A0ABN0YSK2_9BACL